MRRIKDEEERKRLLQRGQELSEQYEKNRQAVQQAEAQTIKNSKVHWVDPTATGVKGVANRIGWIARNAKASADKSFLDTTSAFGQSTIVGLQRGANQAAQEQTTWDKIKNYGKNVLKSYAYTSPDMVSKLLYMSTIGRQDAINENNQVANQIAQNYNQAQTGFGKFGAIAGGVTSKVFQDNNSLVQGIYAGGQQLGQALGEDKAKQTIENITKTDTKLHKKNDKELEELRREGTLYDGVTRKLGETGQTVGYMTPSIAIGLVTGGAGEAVGLAQMGLAAKGSTTREAMQQGADLETAERKGVASGTAEALSEKMFGGLKAFKPFKESGVEDVAKKYIAETIEKRISSQLGQTVAKTAGNWLVDVTGETIEELTTDIYDTWLDQATTDPNAQYTLDDAINTTVGTVLSTTVLNVGYAGLNKGIQKVYDRNQARANNQESIPEAERTESNGYKENLQEMVNNLDIPEEVKAQIQPMLDSDATINAEEYKDITNNIKTLVKANTQQQIADYGAELTTQYNAIEEQRQNLDNIKPENFKDQESRRFYAQQMNKEFSDNTLDTILATYPENRNGNRTVKQYKEIAKEYGKQMALNGLSFDEVRANTVGAWQYYEPNKNITRYDNQQKKNASFERLNSQVWSEEVYNSYRDTMKAQLDQQQKALADTANARLEEIQDEENILIDTIDNLKPRIEAVKSSLVQSAEQYGYKGKQISEIQDLMKRRGINAYFDETQFNNDSEGAFYNPKTNEIVFNPNASQDQVIQELAVHEWYHDLVAKGQGSEIQQSVIDFLKNNKDYQDLRKSLENAYAKLTDPNTGEYLYDIESKEFSDMIDEEATAKTLQRVLGNETEIQRLINYKPSLARRIYDAVVDLLNKFTGGRIEKLYWQDVRNKFEAAFNENGITISENSRYSKAYDNQETLFSTPTENNKVEKLSSKDLQVLREDTSTGTIYQDDNYIYKSTEIVGKYGNRAEGRKSQEYEVYQALKDNPNVLQADLVNIDGKEYIKTPKEDIISTDDIPKEERKYYGRILTKTNVEQIQNAINELSNLNYRYGDNIQIALDKDNNAKLMDFSNAQQVPEGSPENAVRENYRRLVDFLNEFGLTSYADIIDNGIDMMNLINTSRGNMDTIDLFNNRKSFDTLKEIAQKVNDYGTGDVNNVYYVVNQRGTPLRENGNEIYTSENRFNNVQYMFTEKPLSKNFIDDWEITPIYENNTSEQNSNNIRMSVKTANNTTTDNQGRTLTKEQQEYFKDVAPELRDNKNNLKTYYTGTNADFTIFDKNKIDIANLGRGFYFTDNKQIAESYAQRRTSERGGKPRIVEAYIKSLKPFDMDNVTKEQAIDYLTYDFMNAEYVNRTLEQARNEASEFVKEYENDMKNDDAIDYSDLISTSDDNFQQWLKNEGYDSLLVPGKDKRTGLEGTAVVVFEPNQIKSVDNKAPTTNSDIRYSVKTDSQGRELSEEQQEYFKDSKVRDRVGNLLTLYHGTGNNFNVFDISTLGKGQKNAGNFGDGFYFTPNKNIANQYAKNDNIKEVYVDIKNPFIYTQLNEINGENTFSDYAGIYNLVNLNQEWGDIPVKYGSKQTWNDIKNAVETYIKNGEDIYNIDEKLYSEFGDLPEQTLNDRIYTYSKNNGYKTFREVLQEKGYDGIFSDDAQSDNTQYVAFNSNQIKNVDNTKPTTNSDIRYSKDTNFDDWVNNNLPSLGEGKTTLGDLRTEQKLTVNQPETTQTILPTTNVQPTTESLEIPNEQTSLPLGEQVNPSAQRQRQAYQSIIESPVMSEEAKKVARKFIGQDTYTPDSNIKQLERADNIISRLGTEKALNQLESNAMEGRTIKAEDIATGDRLIQYYSLIGDSENLQRAIRATAMAGTQAGRSVQAFALLKHQTPQGMAIWIQNSVDKLNSQMKKGQFDFTPEMQEKILNSTEENLQENANEVMKELGQQVPQDLLGKLDSWRYFSMLANPKTHIRNIVGNFAMGLTQQFKSKVAGTIEQVTGQDRTHTSFLEKRNKANTDFAKNDLKNVAAQLGIGESKYSNPKTQIQQNQRVFKSDALEKTLGRMFKLNDNLLEAEDSFGLKNAYVRNLSDYMTANKLNPNTITNEQLQQARKIAIDEALRATFHQESSLASMLNQLENKNALTRTLVGGLVPFKKTPINVAKSGFEYSPAGLAKAIVYDSVQLRKGNINVNEYIDNISKGLTGTGIALVGYALAEAGILKAAGDDDKEDKYKEAMGEQPYSITINGKSYSLDWLAPTGIPLFVGAELNKLVHDTTEKEGETQNGVLKAIGRVTDATSSLLNPMSEMSMISGLTSTLQSYSQDPGQALMNLPINMLKSYTNQFVPTAVGQVARTMDKYERDTSSTETGLLPKAIDQTKNQIMNKIPGLRQLLPTKKDIWGNEVETQDYFHNAVLPYTKKEVKTNAVDKELNDLYERTGESIYPNTSLSKTVTYEGSKTRLTNQDYNEFKTNYGKTSYKLLEDLTKSQEYKGMTDAQKVQAIKDVYTYANNLNKTEYAEKKGIEFKTPTDVQQVRAVKAYGGKESDYFKYKGITDGLSKDSEKMVALRDSNLSAKSKRAVYSATLGKDDTFFQSTDINVNEYLGYKTANIQGVKDSNGKTISGSKKAAQLDYINNNISGYENRLLLMGKDYKLSRSQQQDLAQYIYTLDNAEDLFEIYSKNFTIKNGNVYYK